VSFRQAGRTMTASLPQTRADWHRRVWALSWPVVLANVTVPLVGLVDTAVMGRLPDPAYLGAVAVGAAVFNAMYWLFGFLRMGTTGLSAQASGAGDLAGIAAIAVRAIGMALALGTAIVLLQTPLLQAALWIFPASAQVESLASDYFTLRVWSAPALLVHFAVLGMLFGLQRMGTALVVSVLLNVCNIGLDLLFVVGFGWGVSGVAAATAISEWLAAGVGLCLLVRLLAGQGGRWPHRAALLDPQQLAALFQVSANLIVRSLFVQLPFFTFTALGAGLGDVVLAANAVLLQLFFVMAYGLDALAHTAESLTGHAFGAHDRRRLRMATGYTLVWSITIAAVLSVLFASAGPAFIDALTALPAVRTTAREYLIWVVVSPLVAVGAFHLDGVYIGTTRTRELRNSMFLAFGAFAVTLWFTIDVLGNHGLWLALTMFMVARTALLAMGYPRLERLAAA
jgi:multidrug resistance protein, MATE family